MQVSLLSGQVSLSRQVSVLSGQVSGAPGGVASSQKVRDVRMYCCCQLGKIQKEQEIKQV